MSAEKNNLESELRSMIQEICDIDEESMINLNNHDPLIGNNTKLQLDSLDALEIAVAVQKKFGVRLDDKNIARQVLQSIDSLADCIKKNTALV